MNSTQKQSELILGYTLVRSKRKTIGIVVYPNGEVKIRAPLRAGIRKITDFVKSKEGWIQKNIQKQLKKSSSKVEPRLFWFQEIDNPVSQLDPKTAESLLYPKISEFLDLYIPKMTLQKVDISVQLKKYNSKWGSCSYHKKFTFFKSLPDKVSLKFNISLAFTPISFVEYLVVHELCHIYHPNHTLVFWKLLEKILPNYKILRKISKQYPVNPFN